MVSSAPPAAIGGIACWRTGGLFQCKRCKTQTSPEAGTIFHATQLPLTLWFAATNLIVTAKSGISSVEFGCRLGIKQPTAWTVKHEVVAVTACRDGRGGCQGRSRWTTPISAGCAPAASGGRGAAGKTPFGGKSSAITGTYRKIGPDRADRHLASFSWR